MHSSLQASVQITTEFWYLIRDRGKIRNLSKKGKYNIVLKRKLGQEKKNGEGHRRAQESREYGDIKLIQRPLNNMKIYCFRNLLKYIHI